MLAQSSLSRPLSSAPAASPSTSSGPASSVRSLTELDERLALGTAGVVVVRVAAESVEALLAHAARRLRSTGRLAIAARTSMGAPLWHEVAARLSLGKLSNEPLTCATTIATNAVLRRAAVIAPLPRSGTWDRAVAAEIAQQPNAPLVVLIGDGEDDASDISGERFDVAPTLHDDAKARWWRAVADEAHAMVESDDLAAYEAWWSAVKRAPAAGAAVDAALPVDGELLFTRLALAASPWATVNLAALGSDANTLAILVSAGAVDASRGQVSIAPAFLERAARAAADASPAERALVAGAITADPDPQPWAFARASELLAHPLADDEAIELSDRAHVRAIAGAEDPVARREIVDRWMRAIEALPATPRRLLLTRSAERALAAGEPDEAARCARAAAANAEDARILLLIGRASAASGDIVAARAALERARSLPSAEGNADFQSVVAVELGEIAYRTGDVVMAREHASAAIAQSSVAATRLKGRNTLGKLLLFEAKWNEADRHFAEDELLAIAEHDVIAELRARLNRGIAVLSKGHFEEAHGIFTHVLSEAERHGEPRARAYALVNLGVIAMRRHEYGAALVHWERTLKLLHVMRDRIAAAHTLANLAELRHTMGLLDHAEHALSFGRRTLGPGITAGRAAHFGVVAARIALSRGRSGDARREIEAAIAFGESSGDRDFLEQAHRVSVRIALEDGDLARAMDALAKARALATKNEALAELALLAALAERAAGRDAIEAAEAALTLARAADKDEVLRETHFLLAELHAAVGNTKTAREHVDQAALVRDKIAEGLSHDVRAAFLARPQIALLARLQARLEARISNPEILEEDSPSATLARSTRTSSPREIVGDDPAIRGLHAAIRKVARSNGTVLIRGESGTGKELIAEALHQASDRRQGPLVTVNCAALVETLLLSELFGHEKGAFTGAASRRRGRFELAEGGTLFLDEIGDISPRTQVALLRVLQERTFERVGGTSPIRADVRIVCATHRDLRAMVERGEFREDLYYRLRGITLEAPTLRARMGDLPRIAAHLLARVAAERNEPAKTLGIDALELLGRHRWPGNVRELENALRTASLFAEAEVITARDLADNIEDLRGLAGARTRPSLVSVNVIPAATSSDLGDSRDSLDDADAGETDGPLPQIEANATAVAYAQVRQGCVTLSDMKRQIERDCIARALAETKGNITRAATLLGMKRPRLSQLVKQYGLAAVSSEA